MQSEKVLMTVQKAFNLFYFISYSLVLWFSLGQDVVGTHLEEIFGLGLLWTETWMQMQTPPLTKYDGEDHEKLCPASPCSLTFDSTLKFK